MIQSQIQRFIEVMLLLTMALQSCNRSVDGFCVGGKKLPTIGANDKCPNAEPKSKCKHPRESGKSEKKEPINNSKSEPAWKGCTDKMFRRDRYETSTATNTNYSRPKSPIDLTSEFQKRFKPIICGPGYLESKKEEDLKELILAMQLRQYNKAKDILKSVNVNLEYDGLTPIFYALEDGNNEIIEKFLNRSEIRLEPRSNSTGKFNLLYVAIEKGNNKALEMLLNKNVIDLCDKDSSQLTPAYLALEMNNMAAFKILVNKPGKHLDVKCGPMNLTPPEHAIFNDNKSAISILIESRVPFKIYGESPLFYFVKPNETEIFKTLLNNKNYDRLNDKNLEGRTILHNVVENGNVDALKLILSHKEISLNKKDKYRKTALDIALRNDNKQIFNILFDQKDIKVNNNQELGCTTLHIAAVMNNKDAFNRIKDHPEINLNKKNDLGQTAADILNLSSG